MLLSLAVVSRGRAGRWVLALAATAALVQLPGQLLALWRERPLLRLWPDTEAQRRLALGDVPLASLREADARLPAGATVLLITSGRDVRRFGYITYHRALYHLTPRPVWWLSPAPRDGTWESRWWRSAPVTAESICDFAGEKGAAFALLFDVPPPPPPDSGTCGWREERLAAGTLLLLDSAVDLRAASGEPDGRPPRSLPFRVAAALVVPLLLGLGAVAALERREYVATRIEALTLGWAFGVGGLTLLLALGGLLRIDPSVQRIAITTLALLALPLALRHGRSRAGGTRRTGSRLAPVEWILLIGLLLQLAIIGVQAVGRPLLVWDSWVTWGMKARVLHLAGGPGPALVSDVSRAVTHLDYPLLLPLAESWLYGWLGVPEDAVAGVVTAGFHLALTGVLYAAARRWGASRAIALDAVLAATVGNHVASLAGMAFADVPLALCVTVAAIGTVDSLNGRPGALIVAAAGAGLMPWTKREGLLLLATLAMATWWVGRRTPVPARAKRTVVALLVGGVLIAGPWWAFVAATGLGNTDFVPVSLTSLRAGIERLPVIAAMVGANLVVGRWNLVWPLAAVLVLLQWRRAVRPDPADLLPVMAATYLFLAAGAYVLSALVPYTSHVASSGYRLAAHVVPLVPLWMALRVAGDGQERGGPFPSAPG